jgi:hypothetical protein
MNYRVSILICLLIVLSACEKESEKEIKPVVQRTEYSPEEFGMGRRHTPDRACNRNIDALLNKIRLCYKNSGVSKKCDAVQQSSNDSIKKLKHSIRCAR